MAAFAILGLSGFSAHAAEPFTRQQIRVVGSSTVFPFVAAAAEYFGRATEYKTPIVESTGTGGGLKLFCDGVGEQFPDMANASRAIKPAEVEQCATHGVTNVTELMIGYDGIVLANALNSPAFDITKAQLFLGLARDVPKGGSLVPNPYKNWQDIDASLPNLPIRVYGPPPTSGTRDAFVELVMEQGCKSFPEYEVAYPDKDEHKAHCTMVREDGAFIEAGENDNLIVQKLVSNPESLGIFGFSFLDQNASHVKANKIGGVQPSFENIADGEYGIARSLFVYIKGEHVGRVPGLGEFARSIVSDEAVGDDGYLIIKGLIPLPEKMHKKALKTAKKL